MKKRLLLLLVAPILLLGIYLGVILVDIILEEPGTDSPMGIGSFNVIESSAIDPTTILSSLNYEGQNLFSFKPGLPEDPPFVDSVEWRQEDFLNLTTSIFHFAWNESINEWKLYRMAYFTECDHPEGFFDGEFYFYLETSRIKQYSVRGILMEPDYGYVAWGGDTYYNRPLFGWKVINLKDVIVTAEEALHRAGARGGTKARQSWEKCFVSVIMWPEAFGRYDWRVRYWDNNAYTYDDAEFWIPTK